MVQFRPSANHPNVILHPADCSLILPRRSSQCHPNVSTPGSLVHGLGWSWRKQDSYPSQFTILMTRIVEKKNSGVVNPGAHSPRIIPAIPSPSQNDPNLQMPAANSQRHPIVILRASRAKQKILKTPKFANKYSRMVSGIRMPSY